MSTNGFLQSNHKIMRSGLQQDALNICTDSSDATINHNNNAAQPGNTSNPAPCVTRLHNLDRSHAQTVLLCRQVSSVAQQSLAMLSPCFVFYIQQQLCHNIMQGSGHHYNKATWDCLPYCPKTGSPTISAVLQKFCCNFFKTLLTWFNVTDRTFTSYNGSHSTACSNKANLDLPPAAIFGPELQRLEPAHIVWVVEHPPDGCLLFVDPNRVS